MNSSQQSSEATRRLQHILGKIDRARGKLTRLTRDEVQELPALYRAVVAVLADDRARGVARSQLAPLEAMVIRAHGVLYVPPRPSLGRASWQLLRTFPHAVRSQSRSVALAAILMAAGALWGYAEIVRQPSSAAILLPDAMQQNALAGQGAAGHDNCFP